VCLHPSADHAAEEGADGGRTKAAIAPTEAAPDHSASNSGRNQFWTELSPHRQHVLAPALTPRALADALGKDGVGVAISQVMPFPWGPAVPVVREYQQLSTKQGHTDFNFSAIEGYVDAQVFVEGLKRAGRNLTREKFIDTLEQMHDVDVGGFFVGYSSKSHAGSRYVDLTIIARDGNFMR
jgi:hypothetical protein